MRYLCMMIMGMMALFQTAVHAYNDEPGCFQELQRSFFPYEVVVRALSSRGITQSRWDPIARALNARSTTIPLILKRKASKMERDPLDHPFQADVAANLLKEVLFEVFKEVMAENGVISESDIKEMFIYIGMQQGDRWRGCLKSRFQ